MSYNDRGIDTSIIGTFISLKGLLSKVFGQYTDEFILDDEIEDNKMILKYYGITNGNDLFRKKVNARKTNKVLKIIFRFYDPKSDDKNN